MNAVENTVEEGGIEKYLNMAIQLAARYDLDPYIRQRLDLIKDEINVLFVNEDAVTSGKGQFNLSKFI